MEKDLPPPYSMATNPPGFQVPPNQLPPQGYPQGPGYPPGPGYPQGSGYPQGPGYPQGVQQQGSYPTQPGPYPTQPGLYPTQQGATTVVVTTVPMMSQFGPNPQPTTCPHCHHQVTTRVDTEPGAKTHMFALILCLFGCIPCCLLPYCMDSCQNQNHYCPQCNAYLGDYNADRMYRRGY